MDDLVLGDGAASLGTDVGTGVVNVFAGNDLFLQSTPKDPRVGETIDLSTRSGVPGSTVALAAVAIDGVPSFRMVTFGVIDNNGEWNLSGPVTPNLSGLTVTFQTFAIGSDGAIDDSAEETVSF